MGWFSKIARGAASLFSAVIRPVFNITVSIFKPVFRYTLPFLIMAAATPVYGGLVILQNLSDRFSGRDYGNNAVVERTTPERNNFEPFQEADDKLPPAVQFDEPVKNPSAARTANKATETREKTDEFIVSGSMSAAQEKAVDAFIEAFDNGPESPVSQQTQQASFVPENNPVIDLVSAQQEPEDTREPNVIDAQKKFEKRIDGWIEENSKLEPFRGWMVEFFEGATRKKAPSKIVEKSLKSALSDEQFTALEKMRENFENLNVKKVEEKPEATPKTGKDHLDPQIQNWIEEDSGLKKMTQVLIDFSQGKHVMLMPKMALKSKLGKEKFAVLEDIREKTLSNRTANENSTATASDQSCSSHAELHSSSSDACCGGHDQKEAATGLIETLDGLTTQTTKTGDDQTPPANNNEPLKKPQASNQK